MAVNSTEIGTFAHIHIPIPLQERFVQPVLALLVKVSKCTMRSRDKTLTDHVDKQFRVGQQKQKLSSQ